MPPIPSAGERTDAALLRTWEQGHDACPCWHLRHLWSRDQRHLGYVRLVRGRAKRVRLARHPCGAGGSQVGAVFRSRHYRASVRIETGPGQEQAAAYLWLTLLEAAELRDALNDLLDEPRPDWHAHVSSPDYAREVTVALDAS